MAKKAPKMTVCKNCEQQYAAGAKACPYCGAKNKKPFYTKVWFWVIIAVLVIAVAASGGGSEDDDNKKIGEVGGSSQQNSSGSTSQAASAGSQSQSSSGSTGSSSTPAAPAVQDVYHVGDILHDGNMDIVYMASGTYAEDNQFLQPQDGMKYIFVQFAFLNTSDRDDSSVTIYSFECYADGYNIDAYYGGDDQLSATLSPGRSTTGYLYFEVPQDAQQIEIEYEPNFLTQEKINFAFEGDLDAGYVPPKDTTPTEGAIQVGQSVKIDDVNFSYVSCTETVSDNMFIKPKDGYRFVTAGFELENQGDSDESISSLSFNCYADGAHCEQSYFADDNLSATMSPGRKAKGTVTFEVPVDAAVVEIEYTSGFFTTTRTVFNALPVS